MATDRRDIALRPVTPADPVDGLDGRAWGEAVFLVDIDVHAKFLLALLLLIVAELVVHQRMRAVVRLRLGVLSVFITMAHIGGKAPPHAAHDPSAN